MQGVGPSNPDIKAIPEYAPPQTYTEIGAFLDLMGHYRWFIKALPKLPNHIRSTWLEREPVGSWNECPYLKRLLRHSKH